jgi:hypothetical protein
MGLAESASQLFSTVLAVPQYIYLPIIQRISNAQEKNSTGVSPADLVFTNAIHMQTNLYSPTDSAKAAEMSAPIREVLDKMIAHHCGLDTD